MIQTPGLILRPFQESDAANVFEYLQTPAVNYFAITLKESGKVIGEIDAYPE